MSAHAPHRIIEIPADAVRLFRVPTEEPESDGTLKWDHTDAVVVQLKSGDTRGIGYTYADKSTAVFIADNLLPTIEGRDPMDIEGLWYAMRRSMRNLGQTGVAAMAVSAVDNALWDLKARLLKLPLCKLLGMVRDSVEVYASGGFTSYDPAELADKFGRRLNEGHRRFKMKIGRDTREDIQRLEAARHAIGDAELFVDANGAYHPKQALEMAERMREFDVSWFEEPVTSDDLAGLRFVRNHLSAKNSVAAGEYGYNPGYFKAMLDAASVDVLQADATRCMGITGFIKAHALCEADHRPLSAHCAPSLHLHVCLALNQVRHIEYFRDHARLENLLFEGTAIPHGGVLTPDLSRHGLGLKLKNANVKHYGISL